MGRLTIEQIIEHCEKITKQYEEKVSDLFPVERIQSKTYWEHKQVAEYLKELQRYKDLEEQGRLMEVVRCKECWRYDTGAGYDGWGLCELYDQDRKDNDYCSFGELKELEDD